MGLRLELVSGTYLTEDTVLETCRLNGAEIRVGKW